MRRQAGGQPGRQPHRSHPYNPAIGCRPLRGEGTSRHIHDRPLYGSNPSRPSCLHSGGSHRTPASCLCTKMKSAANVFHQKAETHKKKLAVNFIVSELTAVIVS